MCIIDILCTTAVQFRRRLGPLDEYTSVITLEVFADEIGCVDDLEPDPRPSERAGPYARSPFPGHPTVPGRPPSLFSVIRWTFPPHVLPTRHVQRPPMARD